MTLISRSYLNNTFILLNFQALLNLKFRHYPFLFCQRRKDLFLFFNKNLFYASALGLKKESKEWFEFFDLAAAHRGKIPEEIMEDEKLVAKLPMLFRTLRGEKVSDKKLNELIEKIRKS